MSSRRKVKQLQFCIVGFIMVMLYNLIETPVKQNNVYNRHNLIMKRPEATLLSIHKKNYIDCHKIIEGSEEEILKANALMKVVPPFRFTDEDYINKTKDCVQFRNSMKYDTYYVTDEEKEFPIAFSILTYKDSDQTERLLRAIYRPQNVYCMHVDGNSPPVLHIALNGIANCFENVFIVSKTEKVFYNHMTRLKADLNCMTDLLAVSKKWKYFINLPHQTFPLRTNLEIVKILKIYNGSNDIEGIITPERMMPYRIKFRHRYIHKNHSWVSIGTQNSSLPHNAAMVKGSAYGIFSRSFIRFVIHDKKAKDILHYLEDVKSPDEYYWAILNHNKVLQAPGQFTGNPEKKTWNAVYVSWGWPCHGKFVRGICIFGVGDLNQLVSRKELFANKFYPDYQYLAMDCIEEYIYNKSFSNLPFETFYYKNMPFINK